MLLRCILKLFKNVSASTIKNSSKAGYNHEPAFIFWSLCNDHDFESLIGMRIHFHRGC